MVASVKWLSRSCDCFCVKHYRSLAWDFFFWGKGVALFPVLKIRALNYLEKYIRHLRIGYFMLVTIRTTLLQMKCPVFCLRKVHFSLTTRCCAYFASLKTMLAKGAVGNLVKSEIWLFFCLILTMSIWCFEKKTKTKFSSLLVVLDTCGSSYLKTLLLEEL